MTVEQTLTGQERSPSSTSTQLQQLVGLVEYDADRDPFPVTRLGRGGVVGRQRHPGRALLPVGVRDGAGRLLRAGDRQPRPPRVRAAPRGRPVRAQGRRRPGEPAARPPPPPRRRHRRHRARGARRRPLHRARPRAGRDDPRRAARPHRRARHRADRRDRHLRRHPAHASSTGPATPARTCPATSPARRRYVKRPRARRSGCSRRSTTSSATSSSARWTSGSTSTTGSWASPTWPSSSATTSPPSTPR